MTMGSTVFMQRREYEEKGLLLLGATYDYEHCRSTQRAVLQKSCSTMGILLGKLIQFYVLLATLNTSAGRFSRKMFVK